MAFIAYYVFTYVTDKLATVEKRFKKLYFHHEQADKS